MTTTNDPYRERLLAAVEAIHQKPLHLWTDEECKARLARNYIAELDLPKGTVLSDNQLWRVAWERNPELREIIATWWTPDLIGK